MIKPDPPFIVHHIEGRRSERVAWLCEELGLPYELKFVSGDVSGSLRALRTPGLNSMARFFGGCLWPAIIQYPNKISILGECSTQNFHTDQWSMFVWSMMLRTGAGMELVASWFTSVAMKRWPNGQPVSPGLVWSIVIEGVRTADTEPSAIFHEAVKIIETRYAPEKH